MKHKHSHWLFLTNDWLLYTYLVFLFFIIAFWLFEEATFEVAETLLAPWFVICRALTPLSWPAERGNYAAWYDVDLLRVLCILNAH